MKIAIITATFYQEISARLLTGATKVLEGIRQNLTWDVIEVPGCFELPYMAAQLAEKYDGIVALGCVIRGETDHYTYVCQGTTYGIQKVSIEQKIPIGFGILTCENRAQALARSDDTENNKGYFAAQTLLSLLAHD